MDILTLRKLLRQDAPVVYQTRQRKVRDFVIPNETPEDFIKDLEQYNNNLILKEKLEWKKL